MLEWIGNDFFSWCNPRCVFCQNWEISQRGDGWEVEPEDLAGMMLDLQSQGCHNINLMSPSHVVAQVLAAVHIARGQGLRLPLVYNTGGYDSAEALALLDGVIDIYMPDMKYGSSEIARKGSMDQYRSCHKDKDYPPPDRVLTNQEFVEAHAAARRHGLKWDITT